MRAPAILTRHSIFWRSGLSAALYLGLSVPALPIGLLALGGLIPMSRGMQAAAAPFLAVTLLAGYSLAAAQWGRVLARQTGVPDARRLAWAAGPAFGLLTLGAAQTLGQVELIFVQERAASGLPVHVVFALAFTAAAFVVSAGVALSVGWAARDWRFGVQLALWAGLAAALAFLFADVAQDLLGRRVGGPGAERTATMLTVAFLGNFVAAFAGGGVMGWCLAVTPAALPTSDPRTVEIGA